MNVKKDIYEILNNLIRILLIISCVIFGIIGKYDKMLFTIITIFLTFYDKIVKKILKIELSNSLKYVILFMIIATEYMGSALEFYDKLHWWDTFVHGMSGIMNFYIGLELINKLNKNLGKEEIHSIIQILFGISFSLAILGLWEIAEFLLDEIFNMNMQITSGLVGQDAIFDTIIDMISATIGTIIATILHMFRKRSKSIKK